MLNQESIVPKIEAEVQVQARTQVQRDRRRRKRAVRTYLRDPYQPLLLNKVRL